MTPTISQTSLANRLSGGKLPVAEALNLALKLADVLRKVHDSGRVYGALTPDNIQFTSTGVELAVTLGHVGGFTPYTAPELLHGKPADARSDIFAFGAILFEMLTGRRAFGGDDDASLAAALNSSAPPSSGSPLVDRVVASCLAKDPAARCQRMQKIIMELKLLSVAARRAETPAPNRGQAEAQLRAEMRQMEARFAASLESHERTVAHMHETHEKALAQMQEEHKRSQAEMQGAAGDAVDTLRTQLAELTEVTARTVEAQERMAQPIAEMYAMGDQIVARVEQTIEPFGDRIAGVEQIVHDLQDSSAALHRNVAADLNAIEQSLKTHAAAIESARTAMAQTDDLVERVVEALELLQSSVLEQHEDRAAPID